MVFSSMMFVCIFFPLSFIFYWLVPKSLRNYYLLLASLVFYGWDHTSYILLMLFSIAVTYMSGVLIDKQKSKRGKQLVLTAAILINLGLLAYFKYFNFLTDAVNTLFGSRLIDLPTVALPVGISFYTFQSLSYLIDLYRGEFEAQKNPMKLALYVSLFPQLIAGPIVKYRDINDQIECPDISAQKTAQGIERFIWGLSKKAIIANPLAAVADSIFNLPASQLSTGAVWLAAFTYMLQIYFDFSGYSDMAIGIGKMFGFDFMENFNYPYLADSVRDFWRRWHISLSTWFREYLYIPLGGNRKGKLRTYINLMIVFIATGLWHGAAWNFVVWGLYYGIFLILERMFLGKLLEKNKFKFINRIYTLLTVLAGWILFRADTLSAAGSMLKTMVVPNSGAIYSASYFLNPRIIFLSVIGILFAGVLHQLREKHPLGFSTEKLWPVKYAAQFCLLFYCMVLIASSAYNPFIYFRF